MKEVTAIAMLLFAAVALPSASALDRLCINADNSINKLYVDGRDMTSLLPNRKNLNKCDCVEIPPNSGVIAVEATNFKGAAGIQSCETSGPAIYDGWRCRPVKKVKSPNWYRPDYDSSGWKPARHFKCLKHCHQYYRIPCPMYASKCFWSHKNSRAVRCRMKQCGDDCTGCKNSGPGSCDPGKCRYGDGYNNVTENTNCNRRCHLEIKAWGQTGEAANGYIKTTDLLTKFVETYSANVAGSYFATIDMSNCKVTNRMYRVWANNDEIISITNNWNDASLNPDFVHVIGIGLGVGPSNGNGQTGSSSFAPYYEIWKFGEGNSNATYIGSKKHGFSATLIGVQNGPVAFNDVVETT